MQMNEKARLRQEEFARKEGDVRHTLIK